VADRDGSLIPGWTLQAMALDRGRVAVVQPVFTMTIVFALPLGWWLTAQTVTHSGGVGGVLGNWMVYVLVVAGLLGIVFQQIALQTARLAPAVATGAVANPLVGVLLGIVLLEERLAPPTSHKVIAFTALGCALAAAVAISLSEERQRRPDGSTQERDDAASLRPVPDAPG
jgi:uncharacterized membrane protein